MRHWIAGTLLSLATTLAAPVQADIYGHVDEDGTVHLSNLRMDARDTVWVKVAGPYDGDEPVPVADPPPEAAPPPYASLVADAAQRHGVEPALLHAVITAESSYDPRAVSPKGAAGLMQLMPATARSLGVADVYDPGENVRGGAHYLKQLLQRFDDDLPLALAAYNAGAHAVVRYGNRVPPYRETRGYVARVMALYRKYATLRP